MAYEKVAVKINRSLHKCKRFTCAGFRSFISILNNRIKVAKIMFNRKWFIGPALVVCIHASLMAQATGPVVAVLNFNNSSGKFYLDEFSRSFPVLLKTELAQKKSMTVVERQRIEDIIKEQDFVLSDLADDKDKQAKVGDLLGADYVITGDVTEVGDQIRVDVSVMQVSSGKVLAEKAILPSAKNGTEAARLLANNIGFGLTGGGHRLSRIALKGAPVMPFFVSTVSLGLLTGVAFNQAKKTKDEYQSSRDLNKINSLYKKADGWKKGSVFVASLTAVSLAAYVTCLLKNRASKLEVIADDGTVSILPTMTWQGSSVQGGIQMNFRF